MIFALVVSLAALARASEASYVLPPPAVVEGVVTLTLPRAPAVPLEKHGRPDGAAVFVTGIPLEPATYAIKEGPLSRIQVRVVRKGSVILFTTRQKKALEIVFDGAQIVARSPLPAPALVAQTPALESKPLVTEAAPPQFAQAATPSDLGLSPSSPAPLQAYALILLALVMLGGFGWLSFKRAKRGRGETPDIEIVAMKSMGGKTRLALVQAGGERLLLSMSESNTQVLGRVAAPSKTKEALVGTFAGTLDEQLQAGEPEEVTADVEGLIQLRDRRRLKDAVA